jgi:hypothetical protein
MRNSIKKLALGLVALGAFSLTACMSSGSNVAAGNNDQYGIVVVQANTKNLSSLSKPALGKSSVISLDSLIVTAISNAATPDTVTVKLAVGDSGFKDTSTINQNISITLNLKALRSWTISAKTIDVNDSVIHTGSATVNNLQAGQVRAVNLSATPKFAMYKATFNFPDSIYSPTGLFGQKLDISKIELIIDGVVVDDSVATFLDSTNYVLNYDYVATTADSVTLKVYGYLPTSDSTWSSVQNLLYTKTRAISSLSTLSLNNVALDWVGPVNGAANLTVQIGKVGTYDISAGIPPVILD